MQLNNKHEIEVERKERERERLYIFWLILLNGRTEICVLQLSMYSIYLIMYYVYIIYLATWIHGWINDAGVKEIWDRQNFTDTSTILLYDSNY